MERINLPYVLLIVLLAVSIVSFKAAHNGMLTKEIESIQTELSDEKELTIDILNTMPESAYQFRPHQDVKQFGQQVTGLLDDLHIALKQLDGATHDAAIINVEEVQSKRLLIGQIEDGYDQISDHLNNKNIARREVETVNRFLINNARKRGQMEIYLDMKGIK